MVANGACASLRSLPVPLGGCANACVSFFLARCAAVHRGGCKWSEPELALIYVPTCCCGIGKNALRCSLTLGYLRWILARANLYLCTYTDACAC